MSERWVPIPEHEGYEVSSLGQVRNAITGHVLALLDHDRGYVQVHLGRRARNRYVHRLVCAAFNGPPPPDMVRPQADHRNFDRTDNRPENLRWLPGFLNAWRWKDHEDPAPADWQPPTPEQSAALDRRLEAAGW